MLFTIFEMGRQKYAFFAFYQTLNSLYFFGSNSRFSSAYWNNSSSQK